MAKEDLLQKLTEVLVKLGLAEEDVNDIVGKVESKAGEEDTKDEGGDPATTPEDETKKEEPAPTEEDAPVPPTEEVPPVPTEETPAADGSIEQVLAEAAAQEGAQDPAAEPVPAATDPAAAPAPTFDAEAKIADLETKLAEAEKANAGLSARIDSLEEALKAAGVIDGATSNVGDETPKITPSSPQGEETTIDDVISVINGRNR